MAVFTRGTKEYDRVKSKIAECNIPFGDMITALQHHEAIIAGGSMLQCVTGANFTGNDVDVYVPIRHAVSLIDWLKKYKYIRRLDFKASGYGKSFLQQNGIKKVIEFYPDGFRGLPIQIMTVRNKRTPLKVVDSFDLTCCMCWFDGTALHAPDYANIMQGVTTLSWPYAEKVYQGNLILIQRMHKYMNRGIEIIAENRPDGRKYPMSLRDFLTMRQAYFDIKRRGGHDIAIIPEIDFSSIKWTKPEGGSKRLYNTPELWPIWMNKFIVGLAMGHEPAASMNNMGFIMNRVYYKHKDTINTPWKYMTPEQLNEDETKGDLARRSNVDYCSYRIQNTESEETQLYLEEAEERTPSNKPDSGVPRKKYMVIKRKQYVDDGYDSDDYDTPEKIDSLVRSAGYTKETLVSTCFKLAALKPMASLRWVLSQIKRIRISVEDEHTTIHPAEGCSEAAFGSGDDYDLSCTEIDRKTKIIYLSAGYRLVFHPISKPFPVASTPLFSRKVLTEHRLILLPPMLTRRMAAATLQLKQDPPERCPEDGDPE